MSRENVTVIHHPLIQHKLSLMRDKRTSTRDFRALLREITLLMGYDLLRDLPTKPVSIETPLERAEMPMLSGKKLCIVSILRAGNGFVEGMLELVPSARVGHIGLYRDPETKKPVQYYLKLPEGLDQRLVIVVDPMLATGHSAIAAVERIKEAGAGEIRFLCLLAAPEGLENFTKAHPDVPLYTAAIDRTLNEHAYILPGLGDAGDRIYGTK